METNRKREARRNRVRSHGVPKRFDPSYVKKLEAEGMSATEALREACTTMSGAFENPGGGINSFQTLCNVLHYDENLPESSEAKKGKEKTENLLLEFMKKQFPQVDVTAENLDEHVDKWMELPEEKRLRE